MSAAELKWVVVNTGVIKEARLVAQCMHRFCSTCIEKWLRLSKYAHYPCSQNRPTTPISAILGSDKMDDYMDAHIAGIIH